MGSFQKSMYILLVVLFLILSKISAQDSLALMSGKTCIGELSYEDESYVYFNKNKAINKIKLIRYPINMVYSISSLGKETKLYYHQNVLTGNYFSEENMKMYIIGEQDAIKQFNIGFHFLLGFGVGLITSMIDTYEFKNKNCIGYFNSSASVISIVTPFVTSIVIGFPNKKVRKIYVSNLDNLSSEHYKKGFNQVKNYRKTVFSFLGSFTGVVSILTATFIHQENNHCP